jgi:hypothetical protein
MQKQKYLVLFFKTIFLIITIFNIFCNCVSNSKLSLKKKEILIPNNLDEIYQTNIQKEFVRKIIP